MKNFLIFESMKDDIHKSCHDYITLSFIKFIEASNFNDNLYYI